MTATEAKKLSIQSFMKDSEEKIKSIMFKIEKAALQGKFQVEAGELDLAIEFFLKDQGYKTIYHIDKETIIQLM